jgi:hypothetical protein
MNTRKRRSINESTLISAGYGFPNGAGMDNTLSPASYNVQGKQPGYIYSILPMTDTLQQKPNKIEHEYYIHPGCTVRGVGFNNKDKHYTGIVNRIVKNEKGEVVCLYVQSFKTAKLVAVRVDDNLELILPKDVDQYGGYRLSASNNIDIQNKGLANN